MRAYHALPASQVLTSLGSSENGLTEQEAKARIGAVRIQRAQRREGDHSPWDPGKTVCQLSDSDPDCCRGDLLSPG